MKFKCQFPCIKYSVSYFLLQVFKTVGKPLVDAVFSGFNGTLMAYGQTGTGERKIYLYFSDESGESPITEDCGKEEPQGVGERFGHHKIRIKLLTLKRRPIWAWLKLLI